VHLVRVSLLLALLGLASFAGCLGEDVPRPPLRGFTAVYERDDGMRVQVKLDGPRDVLAPDGQVRPAYTLSSRWDPSQDAVTTWSNEDLDATLRVVRHEGCFVWSDDHSCQHERIDFRVFSEHPGWGVGLPLRLPAERHGDRIRVADPLAASDDLADNYYEYKPGELWPQRHVRASKDFEYEHESFRLVSVEPGADLSGAVEWPAVPTPPHAAAHDELFPGADTPFLDLPFTVTEAVEALRSDPDGGPWLDGGCISSVSHHAWPRDGSSLPLPPLSPQSQGDLSLGAMTASGVEGSWLVRRVRDTLGKESYEVEPGAGSWHSSFSCPDRAAPLVPVQEFLDRVPAGLARSDSQSFFVRWWRMPESTGLAQASYEVQWHVETGHYRSATMDASTGWWLEFTYLPGEGLDPEQNG
jgi:hypothetical protein